MMRNLNYKLILLKLCITLFVPCLVSAGEAPSDDVKNVAREGFFTHYKNRGDKQDAKKQAERDNATLGEGFRIYHIDIRKLTDDSTPQDLQALAIPQDEWKFPVVSGGKSVTFIKAKRFREKWDASGSSIPSSLPTEMDGIMATWPVSSGYSHKYIRGTGVPADFIELSKEDKILGYIPLSALMAKTGRTKGEYKPGDLLGPQEMLKELRLQTTKENECSTPPDEIMNVAREVFRTQVKDRKTLELGDLRVLGFKSQDDKENAELGEPFRDFYLDTGKLLDASVPQDMQSLVSPGEWRFPIVVNGETRSMLTLRFSDGVWREGKIDSGGGVARELNGLRATWPTSSGYQHRYITTGRFGRSSYFEISHGGTIIGVIPLKNLFKTPGRVAGEFKPGDLRDPQEVLNELRPQVESEREWNRINMESIRPKEQK